MRGIDRYKITEWFRLCSLCKNKVYHKNKHSLSTGIFFNKICWECRNRSIGDTIRGEKNGMFNKHHSIETKNRLRKTNLGSKHSEESILKMRKSLTGLKRSDISKQRIRLSKIGYKNPFYGKKHTNITKNIIKQKLKIKHFGKNNPFYGKTHSEDIKLKLRKNCLERIKQTGVWISFNKKSCGVFNNINNKLNWNGLYALNGGKKELKGYSIDFYEPNLNLIIEWDEERHYKNNGGLLKEDVNRQTNLLKTNCHFYRIREKTKSVYKTDCLSTDYTTQIQNVLNEYYEKTPSS